jgi:signal transduction histidine kinase
LLVQSFSDIHRRQLQAQKDLNEQLLANQAALQESLARLGEAEESLRRKERLAALGELSAGIAHEIRNPLGIIASSAQLIEKKLGNTPADVGQLLDIIQEESTRINGLVTDFISFGRPDNPVLRPCDLQAFLQRAAEHVEGLAQPRDVAVHIEPEGVPLTIRFDADMMQQVVLNLLLNALAAVAPGGRIRLRAYRQGERICFDVEDNGCGVPVENQEKIFDPFFTTSDKGTGLGLANAFRIVEAHGGDLRMRSEPGQGSVFTVCLPAEEE